MILATGTLLTFPTVDHKVYDPNPDCFTQGYKVLKKMATYYGPGPDQGWVLNNSNIGVAGWYCR